MDKQNNNNSIIDKTEFVLPRLNVAVYSVGNHLSDIGAQLMLDRRLVNSKVSIFGGGVVAAINYYKENLTPDMLIIEVDSDLNNMMNDLFELSEVCDAGTRVVIAGKTNDIELYRELIRQGISEYLVLPTTPTGLIAAISNLYQDKSTTPMAPAVAFIGATGGAGTSMISQSIALNLANNYGIETIFADLDTAYPMTSLSWSLNPLKNIDTIIQTAEEYVDDALLKSCLLKVYNNLSLLTAPVNPMVEWDCRHIDMLSDCIKAARHLSDYTIIDVPAGRLTSEKQAAILNASAVAIVTEPTIKGIRNLGVIYEAIKKLRPNDDLPKVILNKIGCPDATHLDNRIIYDNIGIMPDVSIRYVPEIIDLAIARGVPVSSIGDSTLFNEDIQQCTSLILGKEIYPIDNHSMVSKVLNNIKRAIGL